MEPWWNPGGTLVEPWWNPGGTLVEPYLRPPRTTPEPIWAETPKLSAVGEKTTWGPGWKEKQKTHTQATQRFTRLNTANVTPGPNCTCFPHVKPQPAASRLPMILWVGRGDGLQVKHPQTRVPSPSNYHPRKLGDLLGTNGKTI